MTNPPKNDTPDKALVERDIATILQQAEEWKRLAKVIGCECQGFDNNRYAAFYSPDGNVWQIGPKTKAFIETLSQPQHGGLSKEEISGEGPCGGMCATIAGRKCVCGASPTYEHNSPVVSDATRRMEKTLGAKFVPHPTDTAEEGIDDRGNRYSFASVDTADRREAIARIVKETRLYALFRLKSSAEEREAITPDRVDFDAADAIASLIAVPPEGFVMVPVEPTEAMLRAGADEAFPLTGVDACRLVRHDRSRHR